MTPLLSVKQNYIMKTNIKLEKTNKLIKNTLFANQKDYYIIGISGGIDSLVALKILINNVGKEKIKAFYLPIENQNDLSDINLIEKKLDIKINIIDMTNEYVCFSKKLNFANKEELANIKPKLRSIYLSSFALSNNGLVVSCLNFSEYWLGYFTKYGDSSGDVFPLINFLKSEIYKLAVDFNLPIEIIKKDPSAGLLENQTDETDFGFTYDDLEKYLLGKNINKNISEKIQLMNKKNQHKHTLNSYIFDDFLLRDK